MPDAEEADERSQDDELAGIMESRRESDATLEATGVQRRLNFDDDET